MTTILYSLYYGLLILIIAMFFTFLTMILLIYSVKILSLHKSIVTPTIETKIIKNELSQEKEESVSENSAILIASAIAAYLENEAIDQSKKKSVDMLNKEYYSSWELIGRLNQFNTQFKGRYSLKKEP